MRHIPMSLTAPHQRPAHVLTEQPEPGTPEQLAQQTVERLSGLSDQLRQTATDRLWAEIPSRVEEFGRQDGWAATAPVVVPPEFAELVIIEHAVVSIPAGCTGTLTLAGHSFPNLGAGVTAIPLGKLLKSSEARTLTLDSGTGGAASVALYGRMLPTTGSMAP